MNISLKLSVAALTLTALSAAGHASAQIINFSLSGYSGQGALADSGKNYWNTITTNAISQNPNDPSHANDFFLVPGGLTSETFLDDGTTASSITLTSGLSQEFDSSSFTNSSAFFTPYEFVATGQISSTTDDLNGLAAGTYNLFLYGNNGGFGGNSTSFSVSSDLTEASIQSTSHSTDGAFVLGTNYVEFKNVSVGDVGEIAFTFTGVGGHEGNFNGLQLQEVSAAPEPSTFALLLAGLGIVVFCGYCKLKNS